MAGRKGLEGLPKPPKRWRCDRALSGTKDAMESRVGAKQEDRARAKAARRDLTKSPKSLLPSVEVSTLALSLERRARAKRRVPSLASMVSMRRYRIVIASWLWKLFVEGTCGPATIIHITPKGWDFTPSELLRVTPNRLLEELRVALYREGAAKAGGYLIAFLDGEYAPHLGLFRVHVHGVAAEGMVNVIHSLRRRKKYKRLKGDHPPVQIKRKPITALPAPLTYLLKADWFSVWRGIKKDGSKGKSGKRRVPPPNGTLARTWLHRWTIDDITLRIHLTVGADGFIVTNNNSYKKGGNP